MYNNCNIKNNQKLYIEVDNINSLRFNNAALYWVFWSSSRQNLNPKSFKIFNICTLICVIFCVKMEKEAIFSKYLGGVFENRSLATYFMVFLGGFF